MAAIDARTTSKKTAIYQGYQRSAVNNTSGPVVGLGIAIKCQPNILPEVLPVGELSKLHKQNEGCMSGQLQSGAMIPKPTTTLLPSPTSSSPICFTVTPKTRKVQNISGSIDACQTHISDPTCCNSSSCNIEFFSFVHSPRPSPDMQQISIETGQLLNTSPESSLPDILSKSQEMYKVCQVLTSDRNTENITCYNSADRDQQVARKSSRWGKTLCSEQQEQLGRLKNRRNLSNELTESLTFKPAMNQNSMRIINRTMRHYMPLETRLIERKKKDEDASYSKGFTFCPKINANSIKLVHKRASVLNQNLTGQVHARQVLHVDQAVKRATTAKSNWSFKPQVSPEKSIKIAETLHTTKRQEMHLDGRKKAFEVSPITKSKVLQPTQKASFLVNHSRPKITTTAEAKTLTATKGRLFSHRDKLIQTALPSLSSPPQPSSSPLIQPPAPLLASTASLTHSPSCNLAERELLYQPNPTYHQPRKDSQSSAAFPVSPSLNCTLRQVYGMKNCNKKNITRMMPLATGNSSVKQKPPDLDPVEMKTFSSLSERDKVKRVRLLAKKKIKEKKVFLLKGEYRLIRRCLRKRGWVELKYHKAHTMKQSAATKNTGIGLNYKEMASCRNIKIKNVENDGGDDNKDESDEADDLHCNVNLDLGLSDDDYSDEEEYIMLSRSVRNATPNLVWSMSTDRASFNLDSSTVTNHFSRASSFTTKVGICTNLRNLRWYGDTDSDTFFPRCYRLASEDEREMFIEDFRFTAAVAILKIVSNMSWEDQPSTIGSSHMSKRKKLTAQGDTAIIPDAAVQLALRAGEFYLGSKKHFDVESSELHLCPKVTELKWNEIVQHYYNIKDESHVECSTKVIEEVNLMLEMIKECSPQFSIDGIKNMWIVKPGAMSRGREPDMMDNVQMHSIEMIHRIAIPFQDGIMCLTKLDEIVGLESSSIGAVTKANHWVVQKYIEKPLLIFNTKFDIRQWFLVTNWNPLTMWMYKECYLRFSTQPFTLKSLDVSVHLCNNSIQRHFENCPSRSESLPSHNMWDSCTFQQHLNSMGEGNRWDTVIYPGMKKALIHVLQVTQDEIEHKKNSFELYGADFMIGSDFCPWLIEINSCPTMESSTDVTTRLCQQVLEDTIKVVVDRRDHRDCDTGRFELAFRQPRVDAPPYVGTQLCVKGSAMTIRHKAKVDKSYSFSGSNINVVDADDGDNGDDTNTPVQQLMFSPTWNLTSPDGFSAPP